MFISNKTNIEIYTVYAEENDKETIRESRNVDGSKQKKQSFIFGNQTLNYAYISQVDHDIKNFHT